jgi:hypothetical protein
MCVFLKKQNQKNKVLKGNKFNAFSFKFTERLDGEYIIS